MPELPEVEGARKLVQRSCQGKRIVRAVVAEDEKVIEGVAPNELQAALKGRTLAAARRRGKQMWWEMDGGPALLVHFGMTGGLVVKGIGSAHYKSFSIDDSSWPPKYCKVELEFEDGTQLAFCDSRRFARVKFLEGPETRPPISQLGWDPILDWPTLDEFAGKLGKQRRAIKAVLLDQSFSAGVGNWVADEVLYQARIHPEQPGNSIPEEQVAALHRAIKEVCELACSVDAEADRFPATWLFHYRWGKGSKEASRIGGHTIQHITVGGRTSAFVPALQKLSKAAIAAAATKAARAAAKVAAAPSGGGGKKAAAKGRKKQEEEREEGEAEGEPGAETGEMAGSASGAEEAASQAGAEAAVAVAQGQAKPRGGRGKAAAARQAAAAAAEAAEAVAQGAGGSGVVVPAPRSKAGWGRQSKEEQQQEEQQEEGALGGEQAAAAAAAAAGRGAKRFRGRAGEAPQAVADSGAAKSRSKGTAGAKAARAGGTKRKAPASAATEGGGAARGGAVRGRRGKAGQ